MVELLKYIQIDPKVMDGKPFIKGTGITVSSVLEMKNKGETVEDILKVHPQLTEEAVRAAIAYGSDDTCKFCC